MQLPKVKIGPYELSRLICGANPFNGFSHFSAAKDAWLKRYFTVERVVGVLEKCLELGINAIVSSARVKIAQALDKLKDKTGKRMIWVATTRGDQAVEEQVKQIEELAEYKAEFCLLHGGFTDGHLQISERQIKDAEYLLQLIREKGMVPGISTHRPETIIISDERNYDAELYFQPINALGFMSPFETPWVSQVIKNTQKPVIAIKPLASGRLEPQDGLLFAFSAIKDTDAVTVGMMSPEEVEQNVKITLEILSQKLTVRTALPLSPSKSTLTEL